MSNAAKHRKKAAEFEQLRQIDRAIASYIKAIDESEASGEEIDVALLNKVGDLTLRQGRVADAVTYYERAVEHYASSGLFNNAIALCNKILRSSPGRAKVYFTLGRICAKKGLRGDATRNFLEYATRMQQENRVDEGMRALAEVANLMPELTEVRRLVEEHAERAGIVLDRRQTPVIPAVPVADPAFPNRINKSSELVFLDTEDPQTVRRHTPPLAPRVRVGVTPAMAKAESRKAATPSPTNASIDSFLLFDPSRPGAVTPPGFIKPVPEVAEVPSAASVESVRHDTEREIDAVVDQFAELTLEPTGAANVDDLASDQTDVLSNDLSGADPDADGDEAVEAGVAILDWLNAGPEGANGEPSEQIFESILEIEPEPVVSPLEGIVFDEPVLLDATSPNALSADQTMDLDQPTDLPFLDGVEPAGANPLGFLDELSPIDMVDLSVQEATPVPPLEFLVENDALADDAMAAHAALHDVAAADEGVDEGRDQASDEDSDEGDPLEFLAIEELPGLVAEDFDHVADDPTAVLVTGGRSGTPPYSSTPIGSLTPIDVSRIPEIEEAIEAGALAAAMADADPDSSLRPPFRFDPHNFILPGELPPLAVDDESVDGGLGEGEAPFDVTGSAALAEDSGTEDQEPALDEARAHLGLDATPAHAPQALNEPADALSDALSDPPSDLTGGHDSEETPASRELGPSAADGGADQDIAVADSVAEVVDHADRTAEASAVREANPVAETIAEQAAEANMVAVSRRDELQAAVNLAPQDFGLRRRLAEALFDAGARESGLSELQMALSGFAQRGDLSTASAIAEELVRISPDRIPYHQKRVELAVRTSDQAQLRLAYLDLADTLIRMGDDTRAHAVYARVLEIDPWDERARSALGVAAPPPPPPTGSDDGYVDLASFLQDGETASTRMRMREPEVSGDEQADFDSLLRHFKEGVARSLEEEDYESHYDLGVAYKEMGLLDDAIAEFQKALRSRRHRLPAYEALGQCFVEQSRHSVAATVLTRALHEPGLGDEQRIGVLYLLAYSCEALQRWDEARSYYSRVYATDINFRDAAARMAALEQIAR